MTANELADILAAEAQQIMATGRAMEDERQRTQWQPAWDHKIRLEAIASANHQLVFSLLSIAEKVRELT